MSETIPLTDYAAAFVHTLQARQVAQFAARGAEAASLPAKQLVSLDVEAAFQLGKPTRAS